MFYCTQTEKPIVEDTYSAKGHHITSQIVEDDDIVEKLQEIEFPLSFGTALQIGLLDASTGLFCDPHTSEKLTFATALRQRMIDGNSAIYLKNSGEEISLSQCIEKGGMLNELGFNRDGKCLRELIISKNVRLLQNKVKIHSVLDTKSEKWQFMQEALRIGLLSITGDAFHDTLNNRQLTILEAVELGFIRQQQPDKSTEDDENSTRFYAVTSVIDPSIGTNVQIGRAIESCIIDQANGEYVSKSGRMPISQAISQGFVFGKLVKHANLQSTRPKYTYETISYKICKVKDYSGNFVTLTEANEAGIIDYKTGHYILDSGQEIEILEAIKRGLIIADQTKITNSEYKILGVDITTTRNTIYTLHSVLHPITGEMIDIYEALREGIIDLDRGVYCGSNGLELTLSEAIDCGVIHVMDGYIEPQEDERYTSNESLHIDDSFQAGSIQSEELIENIETFEITGVIDPTYVKDDDYCTGTDIINYKDALERGIINNEQGIYTSRDDGEITITEALNRGFIMGKLINRKQERSVFHSDVMAEQSNKVVSVLNPRTTLEISPTQAIRLGLLTDDKKWYICENGDNINIVEAIKRGYVNPSSYDVSKLKPKIAIQEKISRKPYTPKGRVIINWGDGTICDREGSIISRTIALSRGLITPAVEALLSKKVETLPFRGLTAEQRTDLLREYDDSEQIAADKPFDIKILHCIGDDSQDEKLHDNIQMLVQTTTRITCYPECVIIEDAKYIKDVQYTDTSYSLNTAIQLGLYDIINQRFYHAPTDEMFTLQEAIVRRLISKDKVAFSCILTGKKITLRRLMDANIINSAGTIDFKRLLRTEGITVEENLKKCGPRALNMLDAIMCGLLNAETGKMTIIKADGTRDKRNLNICVEQGYIHGDSVLINDITTGNKFTLRSAIKLGIIDSKTGSYIDSTNNKLLFSLGDAISSRLVDNRYDSERCTVSDMKPVKTSYDLEHVMDSEIIAGINKHLVYDWKSTQRVTYRKAIENGILTAKLKYIMENGRELNFKCCLNREIIRPDGTAILAVGETSFPLIRDAIIRSLVVEKFERLDEHMNNGKFIPEVEQEIKVPDVTTEINESISVRTQPEITVPEVTTQVDYSVMLDALRTTNKTDRVDIMDADKEFSETTTTTTTTTTSYNQPEQYNLSVQYNVPEENNEPEEQISYNDNYEDIFTTEKCIEIEEPRQSYSEEYKYTTTANLHPKVLSNDDIRYKVVINWRTGEVSDPGNNEKMSAAEALRRGLIDTEIAILIRDRLKKFTSDVTLPMSLNAANRHGLLIAPISRIENPLNGDRVTVESAINSGIINPNKSLILDPDTRNILTVKDAINSGIMNADECSLLHTRNKRYLSTVEIIHQGLIPDYGLPDRKSVEQALEDGTLKDGDYVTLGGLHFSLEQALQKDLLYYSLNSSINEEENSNISIQFNG